MAFSIARPALILDIVTAVKQYFVATIVLLILSRAVYLRYFHPLSAYPGPFVASFTRLWKTWSVYKGHTELDHIAMHKKYGIL